MRENKNKKNNIVIPIIFLSKFPNVQVVAGYHAADMPKIMIIVAPNNLDIAKAN